MLWCQSNQLLSVKGIGTLWDYNGGNQSVTIPLGVSTTGNGYESVSAYPLGEFTLDPPINPTPASLSVNYDSADTTHFFTNGEGTVDFTSVHSSSSEEYALKITGTITFAFAKYKVSFVDWDGTLINSQEVIHGADATLPPAPERAGYSFSGWSASHKTITQETIFTALYTQNAGGGALASTGDSGVGIFVALGLFILAGGLLVAGIQRRNRLHD